MYYNQYNYTKIPYPSPSLPGATVASGGCGAVSASMIIEALTDKTFAPPEAAAYSIKVGARVSGGTNMVTLSKAIENDFGLRCTMTNNIDTLVKHMHSGGAAIANVSGNRTGYKGLFSDSGHFIVVIGHETNVLTIWDPGSYVGKYNKPGRAGRAMVDGNNVYVAPSVLDADCLGSQPRYFLFSTNKEEDEDMALVKTLMQRTGKTEEEVVQALAVYIQFANTKEDQWEKDGAKFLKDSGLLSTARDGRELVEFGELGVILERFKNKYE